jgi:hypothetical protein
VRRRNAAALATLSPSQGAPISLPTHRGGHIGCEGGDLAVASSCDVPVRGRAVVRLALPAPPRPPTAASSAPCACAACSGPAMHHTPGRRANRTSGGIRCRHPPATPPAPGLLVLQGRSRSADACSCLVSVCTPLLCGCCVAAVSARQLSWDHTALLAWARRRRVRDRVRDMPGPVHSPSASHVSQPQRASRRPGEG